MPGDSSKSGYWWWVQEGWVGRDSQIKNSASALSLKDALEAAEKMPRGETKRESAGLWRTSDPEGHS